MAGGILGTLAKQYSFKPKVLVLAKNELDKIIAANPFPDAQVEPKSLYTYFLDAVPSAPDNAALNAIKAGSENFIIKGKVFYLHAPDGVGRSKLAARAEKLLGVDATARNWNTVCKMAQMAKEYK